ncbi:unnamed protein product [Paramecium octaurelia]|uniref:Uncharacterized protein n=1 Tax=Paramecium octaurelia TaxID=43137 RepID=A0A8S1VCD6_PAROT|nr:unnamed protein product [Paramecium octaurelia]
MMLVKQNQGQLQVQLFNQSQLQSMVNFPQFQAYDRNYKVSMVNHKYEVDSCMSNQIYLDSSQRIGFLMSSD